MMKIDEDRMLNRADPMGLPSWIPNHMKQMMSRMHSSMNQMLDNLKEDMPNMLGKSTSGGKLVMINSGPGYHEEKTYNIGPDGEMKLLKKDETHSMNDMIHTCKLLCILERIPPLLLFRLNSGISISNQTINFGL